MKKAAEIISWVFMPLFMPMYGLLIAMYVPGISISATIERGNMYTMYPAHKLYILLLYFVLTCLAPGFSLLILKKNETISDIEVERKEERKWPATLTALYCLILGVFLNLNLSGGIVHDYILALPWAGFFCSIIALAVSRFFKISLHAMGAGILFGFFICYYSLQIQYPVYILLTVALLGGVIMSARLYLQKHTVKEVLIGYVTGVLITVADLTFFAGLLKNY